MADLLEFISAVTEDKKQFCIGCFRTENERKLVTPVALAEFVKLSRLDKLSKREAACIYCERQAELALKLYKTLRYTSHVNQTLWSLAEKKMSPRAIAYLLPSKIRAHTAGQGSVKRNKLLSLLRRYQTFGQTDVLVVDAAASSMETKKLSDGESIVIEDDEEQAETTAVPRLVPIEKLLQNPPKEPTDTDTIDSGSIVLYPMKSNNSENLYLVVPKGADVQIKGNALNVLNNGPTIPVLLPNGNIVGMQSQNSGQIVVPLTDNVHNQQIHKDQVCINQITTVEEIIMTDNRKIGEKIKKSMIRPNLANNNNVVNENSVINYTGNSLQNNRVTIQYIPGNSVIMPNNSSTIQFANVASDQSVIMPMEVQTADEGSDSDQICQITNVRSDNKCQISDLIARKTGGSDMCQISDLRSLQEDVAERPPEPKKKSDPNIDWEDKIPMDVISFMDAKDPNPPRILQSPPALAPVTPPAPKPANVLNQNLESLTTHQPVRNTRRRKRNNDDDLIVIN